VVTGSSTVKAYDVAIVGAGVLGVTIAYWLTHEYECSVALVDLGPTAAFHTSTRNTGVIHRPFYLNPDTKKVFARSASLSFPLWNRLARMFRLPWKEIGTLEVAQCEEDLRTIEKYLKWGARNGIPEGELRVLDSPSVANLENEVRCRGAIFSKRDTSVDFGSFTKSLLSYAEGKGVVFLPNLQVSSVTPSKEGAIDLVFSPEGSMRSLSARYVINAAGGGAVDVAHMMGLASGYTDLHFRGDYWIVGEPFASRVTKNVYSVARRSQFPFLDPHFIVKADGTRQIGPNAALVAGPFTYNGLGRGFVGKLLEKPIHPKLSLFTNRNFLTLVWSEWRSSLSRSAMCERVKRFIPKLNQSMLAQRGLSGVRSSLIDDNGFVPEAVQIEDSSSIHVLNYNSPGATGAPAYSALVIERLKESGAFDYLRKKGPAPDAPWGFDEALGDQPQST
jgi:L-2-hydroxyglutarate oxidase